MSITILRRTLSVFIVSTLLLSCESPPEPLIPIETQHPDIQFAISGGYYPEYLGLEILQSGSATITSLYPELTSILDRSTIDSILVILRDFDGYQAQYLDFGFDDQQYTITLRTRQRSKKVTFTGVALGTRSELGPLGQAVNKLLEIRSRVYYEQATWTGLEYQFGFSDSVYRSSDTIVAQCRITNPTDKVRTIYFRNENELMIQVFGDDPVSHISGYIPDPAIAWGDSTPPHSVTFSPAEEKVLSFRWTQSFVASNGEVYQSLPPATYRAAINLLGAPGVTGWYFRITGFRFSITP